MRGKPMLAAGLLVLGVLSALVAVLADVTSLLDDGRAPEEPVRLVEGSPGMVIVPVSKE